MAEIPIIAGVTGVKLAKDAVKEFGLAFKDLNEFGKDGADKLRQAVDALDGFAKTFDPMIAPMSLLAAKLEAQTLDENLKLSAAVFELMSTEAFKEGVRIFGRVAESFVNLKTDFVELGIAIANIPQTIDKLQVKIPEFNESLQQTLQMWLRDMERQGHALSQALLTGVQEGFADLTTELKELPKEIVSAIMQGIKDSASELARSIKDSILTAVRNL